MLRKRDSRRNVGASEPAQKSFQESCRARREVWLGPKHWALGGLRKFRAGKKREGIPESRKQPTFLVFAAFLLCVVVQPRMMRSSIFPQDDSAQDQEETTNGSQPSIGKQSNQGNAVYASVTIPAYANVYVAPMPDGFENYIIAGLRKKKVPVTVVVDRDKAAYEISGVSESKKKIGIKVSNLKTGVVLLSWSVDTTNSVLAGEDLPRYWEERDAKGSKVSGTVPKGAKIFVAPIADAFDTYLKGAIADYDVPVEIVRNRDLADFEITGTFEAPKVKTAGTLFGVPVLGAVAHLEASIHITNIKNSEVVWSIATYADRAFSHWEKYTAIECVKALKREAIEK
jgi:hypothetical protein